MSKDFVRLGKWFVQPFEGPEKSLQKASHLSFSFQYFVHGESHVCASVDVRQHPAIRRLAPHHLSSSRGEANPVHVILAPYGLAATLTGVTYKTSDANVGKLLQDWDRFYPLDRNRYFCQDSYGDIVTMAPAVEVIVAGVKLIYPTCYVLVADIDMPQHFPGSKARGSHFEPLNNVEPSPFTVSNQDLLSDLDPDSTQFLPLSTISQTEQVWQDSLTVNPESSLSASEQQHQHFNVDSCASDLLSAWDFGNPGRYVKKKKRNPKSKDHQKRFNSKVPFHKKVETLDDLAWALDQSELLGTNNVVGNMGGGGGSLNNSRGPGSNNPNDSTKSSIRDGNPPSLVSPAPGSVGPVTPLGISTPKAPGPPSIGPPTPMDVDIKQPSTPKSVPPPSYPPVPSPFTEKKVPLPAGSGGMPQVNGSAGGPGSSSENLTTGATTTNIVVKSENDLSIAQQPNQNSQQQQQVSNVLPYFGPRAAAEAAGADDETNPAYLPVWSSKRPALPAKEYEGNTKTKVEALSKNILETDNMKNWLNHPVKRAKLSEPQSRGVVGSNASGNSSGLNNSNSSNSSSAGGGANSGDPARPLYRRHSVADGLAGNEVNRGGDNADAVKVKQEPSEPAAKGNNFGGDPYEFSDGQDKRENGGAQKNSVDDSDLFTSQGLQPSIADLDNLFDDDSGDEHEGVRFNF